MKQTFFNKIAQAFQTKTNSDFSFGDFEPVNNTEPETPFIDHMPKDATAPKLKYNSPEEIQRLVYSKLKNKI